MKIRLNKKQDAKLSAWYITAFSVFVFIINILGMVDLFPPKICYLATILLIIAIFAWGVVIKKYLRKQPETQE